MFRLAAVLSLALALAASLLSGTELQVSAAVPPNDVPKPMVHAKTSQSVTLKWADLPGKDHLIWNLIMNQVSVFSGVQHMYHQVGLAPDSCYSFQLAYYWNGQWSQFSRPVNVSTAAAGGDVDPFAIDAELSQLRSIIERRAAAPVTETAVCEMAQILNPQYVAGSAGAVEYIGSLGPLARAGVQASNLNCLLSQCARASASTQAIVSGRAGYLRLRSADGVFEQVYAQIPPAANYIKFNGAGSLEQHAVELVGCRAHNMTAATAETLSYLPGRTAPDADAVRGLRRSCIEVNCTTTLVPLFLCEPTDSAFGADDLQAWKHTINRASHVQHTIQKYEICAKVQAVKAVVDRKLQLYVQAGFREPWIATQLMRLSLSHTSPHFPVLFDFFRCSTVPDHFAASPQSDTNGVLSPFVDGATGLAASRQIQLDTGAETMFATMWMQSFSTTMQIVVNSYKDWALSRQFLQGMAFQLLHALGVARRVFGFHHNDLLTLSNIRFSQIPVESKVARRFWCYILNEEAFSDAIDYKESDLTTVSEMTFGEMIQPDACAVDDAAANATASYCVNADEVDGLRLLLYGYGNSAAIKPELERWKAGWAFQNTPWDDDTFSVAVIICDMLGQRVAAFRDEQHAAVDGDFCGALRNGTFQANPLQALRHEFFATLPKLSERTNDGGIPSAHADIFTYLPKPTKHETNASTNDKSTKDSSSSRAAAPEVKFRQRSSNAKLPALAAPNTAGSGLARAIALSPALETPWIVDKLRDAVTIGWPQKSPGEVANVFMNGVSVYTGTGSTWTQRGLSSHNCYRFQVSRVNPGTKHSRNASVSSPLFVNDCSRWKQKMCRENTNCWLDQSLTVN